MRFLRLFAMDVREGFRRCGDRLILAAGIMGFAVLFRCAGMNMVFMSSGSNPNHAFSSLTVADVLASVLWGTMPPGSGDYLGFSIPITWLVYWSLLFYSLLDYPSSSLAGVGRILLVHGGERLSWLMAKVLWVACAVIAFWAVALAAAEIGVLAVGGEGGMFFSSSFLTEYGVPYSSECQASLHVMPLFIISSIVISIGLAEIQLMLGILLRPAVSYICMIGILIVSVFYLCPVLPGNYLMLIRTRAVFSSGLDLGSGIAFGVFAASLSILIGGIRFSKKDLLN